MEREMLETIPQKSCVVTDNPFREYDHLRIALRDEIISGRETFVRIGYLLKVARDTDILAGSGYNTYLEFAEGEFNLDSSSVSRFIGINDRFSVGHNSQELAPEYKNFGRAKLQEMLTLPDYLTETFTPEMSKSEIKAIKEEYEEEQKITPLEIMVEPDQRQDESRIDRFVYELLKKDKDLYETLFNKLRKMQGEGREAYFETDAMDIMLPCDDFKLWIARPAGLGKCQLMISEDEPNTELTSMRGDFKEQVSCADLTKAILKQIPDGIKSVRAAYETRFGELWADPEEEEKNAPVQEKPKAPEKKKSRVSVAKDKPKKQETAQNKQETVRKSPESVQKEPEIVKESSEMFESGKTDAGSEPLTTVPIARNNQPDPIPEAKPDDRSTTFLFSFRNYDMHGLFTGLTMDIEMLKKNVTEMPRDRETKIYTAAVNEARNIVCLLDEIGRRWREKAELQEEINR